MNKAANFPASPLVYSFESLASVCLAFGLFYAFCFYKNPSAVTWPLFTAAGYGLLCTLLRRLGVKIKKDSFFLIGISVLLSISMCMTASKTLHRMTRLALFLLLAIFLIHQLYEDLTWNIGKYMAVIVQYTFSILSFFPLPFRHAAQYAALGNSKRGRNLLIVIAGLCASSPFVLILLFLLSGADAVFAKMVTSLFWDFFNFGTVLGILFQTMFAAVVLYCILCSRYKKVLSEETKDRRNGNPLIAVSFLSVIVLLYLLFCAIQIFYLFLRQGTLPQSMTYAEYAHQGFFQLVFVVFFNVVLVLCCLKFFRQHRVLKWTLAVISGCTCIMIASAACRMILYVSCYHLTFLRLLVLWFLAMVAVLMAGIFRLIFKEDFPLFRYSLVVISVFYTGFALARPDAVIARYNLTVGSELNYHDLQYLYSLSADAAPELEKYLPDTEAVREYAGSREEFLLDFCMRKTRSGRKGLQDGESLRLSPRSYNVSLSRALKIEASLRRE